MAGTFRFNVVAPQGEVFSKDVEFIKARSEVGDLGILPHHAPLLASLVIGVVEYTADGKKDEIAVSGGFMEVANNQVTILARTAELAEQIDVARAEEAKKRAEERFAQHANELDEMRARAALNRAMARIQAASKKDGQQ